MKIHKSICQNCVYKYHPVMLTTYLRSPGKCDICGYKPGELAMVYFEEKESES